MSIIGKICGFGLILAVSVLGVPNSSKTGTTQRVDLPTTLLISCDGFRTDYLDSFPTPNLDRLASTGIRSKALIPVFPTKTFPNHYSIVTGLYPENHGIVANRMYDHHQDAWFKIGAGSASTREAFWFEGEPIWVTAKKQGLRTATLFWPGSDAAPEGYKPDFHLFYNNRLSYQERINQVTDWLKLPPKERPHFITLYFESPDKEGHSFGPFHDATSKAVSEVDAYIGELIKRVQQLNLTDQINILVTSDHGMSQLSRDRVIFLDDYISLGDITLVETSPKADIIPKPGLDSIVFTRLKDAHPHLSVFRRDNTPEKWHYRKHERITPIMAVADLGWSIATKAIFNRNRGAYSGGAHGYDNSYPEMGAIFIGTGPGFKNGLIMPALKNIHLYELMCHLLQIKPATNDGDLSVFNGFISEF
ncbi:MAG: sulfatase-like hydrolase/transferase [Saprospiraceae bacterium]|nr:sulfatase-like hydrolase/transferase [Saprospiraceae bacterium]